MLSASSAVSWAARSFGLANEAALLAAAATLGDRGARRAPLFLPYLSGERSPHNDADAQGVLFGLTHAHGPADVAYAVVEGVSFGLRDGLDTLAAAGRRSGAGRRRRAQRLVGELLADMLEMPLQLRRQRGRRRARRGAAGLAGGWRRAGRVCRRPALQRLLEPVLDERALLLERHGRFRALYAPLSAAMRRG